MKRLLIVAHPDDETIFFGGLIQTLRDLPWHVICVTDGNADQRGVQRASEFAAATKLLGVKKSEIWSFPDKFPDRLPVNDIVKKLSAQKNAEIKEIYTHGPMGEYGHPHHQDVCLAAHRAFPNKKIYSPAWNSLAEKIIKLTPKQYEKKTKAFIEIYRKETEGFLNILPNMGVEFFRKFSHQEVEALVGYLRKEKKLSVNDLESLAWLGPIFPDLRTKLETRLF